MRYIYYSFFSFYFPHYLYFYPFLLFSPSLILFFESATRKLICYHHTHIIAALPDIVSSGGSRIFKRGGGGQISELVLINVNLESMYI